MNDQLRELQSSFLRSLFFQRLPILLVQSVIEAAPLFFILLCWGPRFKFEFRRLR